MKTLLKILALSTTALLLYNSRCEDYGTDQVYTRIHRDGSCYREIIVHTDSSCYAGFRKCNPFPIKIDSTWNVSRLMETDTVAGRDGIKIENHFLVRASKEYPSVKKMAETFYFDNDEWDSIVPEISYQKKFRWFYTDYKYTETYASTNPFTIPITDYMSEEEAQTWFGENSDFYKGKNGFEIYMQINDIAEKINQWCCRNIYEESFRQYCKYYRYFGNMPVDSLTFAGVKDTIYEKYKINMESDGFFDIEIESLLDEYFQKELNFDAKVSDTLTEPYEKTIEKIILPKKLYFSLSLPGRIIATNAPFTNGDTLSWYVDDNRFFIHDFSLTAKSKKIHYPAFIATGFIIVLSITGIWVKMK